MRQSGEDGKSEHEPASTDDGKSEESSSSHASLGIVQESVDTRVGELSRVVVEEEEVRVEPSCLAKTKERGKSARRRVVMRGRRAEREGRTKVAENLVGRDRSPEVKSDERLGGKNNDEVSSERGLGEEGEQSDSRIRGRVEAAGFQRSNR